jgi:2-polyprenyl-3-methyl-5-hydroxy-6-metoxy-1,4-benzoquinol methylase
MQCCICEEKREGKVYRRVEEYTLGQCPVCRLVYLKDHACRQDSFIADARQELKTDNREKVEYWSFPHLYEKHKSVFEGFFAERFARIRSSVSSFSSMFDIGCGYGFWMKYCQDRGIVTKGIDLSPETVEYATKTLALDASAASLEEYSFDRRYDVMVMCDILEHVEEPNSQLQKIRGALNDAGVLFVQVPNLLGFKLPLRHGFGLPYHLWQFNIKTLTQLLEKNGFLVLKWWTGVMGVVGVHEAGGPRILDHLTWNLARHLKAGNRLMVAARKKESV